MDLHLHWHKAILLKNVSRQNAIYVVDLERIPDSPGIYIFFRSYGKAQEALYIGKAKDLNSRIKQQLNNVKLMKGIENAEKGYRKLVLGEFLAKGGQRLSNSLETMEHALIRHYLSKGHRLLNIHGTTIRKKSLTSDRSELKHFIPYILYFES